MYCYAYFKSFPQKNCTTKMLNAFRQIYESSFLEIDNINSVTRRFANTFFKGEVKKLTDKIKVDKKKGKKTKQSTIKTRRMSSKWRLFLNIRWLTTMILFLFLITVRYFISKIWSKCIPVSYLCISASFYPYLPFTEWKKTQQKWFYANLLGKTGLASGWATHKARLEVWNLV